ncbi:protein tyrosine phosphatase family protein [uncultured Shewanella sp.]|uniref:protein tyrosine phosphatase family protein n=1 Tax=Shewanella atlantica TaxID=271099 RepID=UPI002624E272|nr:protein tyrosine phosphatase family protein [uncultured Shewanella sp.]
MKRAILIAALLTATVAQAEISPDALQDIKAVQFNSDKVITAGLPGETQFKILQQAGVDLVINLIPDGNPSGHEDEASLVKAAGMKYESISVDWKKPTIEDVERFFSIMNANRDKDILIHCVANYRASAFYYLYQTTQLKLDGEQQKLQTLAPWGDLEVSLKKYPQWQVLMEQIEAKHQ